jgi:hypothetical protein
MTTPKDDLVVATNKHINDSIIIDGLSIYVCKRCKNMLGDVAIHSSMLDPWKISLIKRLRGNRYSNIFKNYFGEKQIEKCISYNMKCSECLKNIKNVRCPHFKCGSCCNCKYHKSHYDQPTIGDIIISVDIFTLIQTTVTDNSRKKNKRKSIIVHRY